MTERPPDVPGEDTPPDLRLALQVIADLLADVDARLTDKALKARVLAVLTVVGRLREHLQEP
jgi:hypothetical protein